MTDKKKEPLPNKKSAKPDDPFFRPPNEDDDGYDPYSDRPVKEEFWGEDPWR